MREIELNSKEKADIARVMKGETITDWDVQTVPNWITVEDYLKIDIDSLPPLRNG